MKNKSLVKMGKIRIYKTKPRGKGWTATDPARSAKQAKYFVKGGYGQSIAKAVKTGKKGDVFPYTIYTKMKR